jgi:light-regulated signal transduction histidine kinase (bacteriophytochrome)
MEKLGHNIPNDEQKARKHSHEPKSVPPLAPLPPVSNLAALLADTAAELESLSYTVSHDLRAPLRHIEAFADLLKQTLAGKLDASSDEYLTVIGQSARQMAKLLDGVLSYSRLCRREFHSTPVDLNNALKSVFQEFKLETEGRKIEWHIEPLPTVEGDPFMIRDTLSRLISNALKFTRTRNPARISISVSTGNLNPNPNLTLNPQAEDSPLPRGEGQGEGQTGSSGSSGQVSHQRPSAQISGSNSSEFILRIQDNGIGFDMQYIDRLFGLFQRLHSDPQYEGLGIGLAHVRRMVLRHGGRIWAEAQPDSGATFFLAFPSQP